MVDRSLVCSKNYLNIIQLSPGITHRNGIVHFAMGVFSYSFSCDLVADLQQFFSKTSSNPHFSCVAFCCFLVLSPCFQRTSDLIWESTGKLWWRRASNGKWGHEEGWGRGKPLQVSSTQTVGKLLHEQIPCLPMHPQHKGKDSKSRGLHVGKWHDPMIRALSRGGAAFTSVSPSAVANVYSHTMPICSLHTVVVVAHNTLLRMRIFGLEP